MIQVFKIIKRIYDPACVPHFDFVELSDNSVRKRGNKYKLIQRVVIPKCCRFVLLYIKA